MNQEIIGSCSMIDIAIINAVYNHLSGVTVTLHNGEGFFVDSICHEIFSQCTIITIFYSSLSFLCVISLICAVVVQIFNVNIFDIAIFHLTLAS